MNTRRLAILIALALAVTVAVLWLGRAPGRAADAQAGAPVLAGLAGRLDAVSRIRVVGAGEAPLVTLERRDGHWRVTEADYAADPAKVRTLLVALGDLRVLEQKTTDPARYAVLGVEDPAAAKAASVRVELGGLPEPVALIVGHGAGSQGSYVRVPGQGPALEVRPALQVGRTPRDWLDRALLDLPAARIASVEIARADGPPWRIERKERNAEHFAVPDLPHGAELTSAGAADAIAGAFGGLEADNVRAAGTAEGKHHRVTITCYDGLVVTLSGDTGSGADRWLTLDARFDPAVRERYAVATSADPKADDAGRRDAERLHALAAGHAYQVAAYRFDAIFRARSELLRH